MFNYVVTTTNICPGQLCYVHHTISYTILDSWDVGCLILYNAFHMFLQIDCNVIVAFRQEGTNALGYAIQECYKC